MILGSVFWDDRERFRDQRDNPTEQRIREAIASKRKGYLETCGPSAAVNCIGALGYSTKIICPGPYSPQPEEILSDFFVEPSNDDELAKIRNVPGIPENRVPQLYPYAVQQVFGQGIRAEFKWLKNWAQFVQLLKDGNTIQFCIPGHYIAAVAFDTATNEIIYNDSWPDRKGLKNGGFNERMNEAEYGKDASTYVVIYYKRRVPGL